MNRTKFLALLIIGLLQLAIIIAYVLFFSERQVKTVLDTYFIESNPVESYFESGNIIIEVIE